MYRTLLRSKEPIPQKIRPAVCGQDEIVKQFFSSKILFSYLYKTVLKKECLKSQNVGSSVFSL